VCGNCGADITPSAKLKDYTKTVVMAVIIFTVLGILNAIIGNKN
jgi:hypothetical protein